MELTVVLCSDSDRSQANQTRRCPLLFVPGIVRAISHIGLVFHEHVSVDNKEMCWYYKAPFFSSGLDLKVGTNAQIRQLSYITHIYTP